jgi:arylsulfatase A-like enzyme
MADTHQSHPQLAPRAAWCTDSALLGAAVGVLLAVTDQILVPIVGGHSVYGNTSPSLTQRVVAVLIVGSVHGLVVFTVSAVASVTLKRAVGRVVASAVVGVVIAMLFAWHVLGLSVRLLSGSFVTVGAIEFALACKEQMLRTLRASYFGATLALLATTAVVAIGASLHLRNRSRMHARDVRGRWRGCAVLVAPALLYASGAWAAPGAPFLTGMSLATPELAFFASLDPAAGELEIEKEPTAVAADPSSPASRHRLGPRRTADEPWRTSILARDVDGPNVLLLTLESLSTGHIGYLGYQRRTTPNLDRIAAKSRRMLRAWTTATHSNYAQPAILSSLFPRRGHGLDVYRRLDFPRVLPHDIFHQLGYATATISSQDENWQGMRRFQETDTPTYFWHSDDYRGPHILTSSERAVPDRVTVGKVIDWLKRQKGRPWELYVNLQSTHFPYRLPRGVRRPFQPTGPTRGPVHYLHYGQRDRRVMVNRYDNALFHMDAQVGRIHRYLEATGQLENTVWVITGDHGELFGERDVVTHGRTLLEGEARIPLLVYWPGALKPGNVYDPVSHLDIMPTVLQLVGLPPHPSYQGVSMLGGVNRSRRAVFLNIQGLRLAEAVVCWPWKLIVDRSEHAVRLYHLGEDPDEWTDLVDQEPGVAAVLVELLRKQMKSQVDYHRKKNLELRESHYAPPLLRCPELPGQPPAAPTPG